MRMGNLLTGARGRNEEDLTSDMELETESNGGDSKKTRSKKRRRGGLQGSPSNIEWSSDL